MESKSKNLFGCITALEHEYYCTIWKLVKMGELENLEGRRKNLGQLMIEHPQYQYFWEIPYSFAESELRKAFEQEGVGPDFHLTVEAVIVEQVETKEAVRKLRCAEGGSIYTGRDYC